MINSGLSVKPCENAVFSRHFACFVFQPYVFSLVFALTSRNKGKFFSLRRLPYPVALRKYVRKAIDAAAVPSVRQEYCFPLTVNLYTANRRGDFDDDPEEYDGRFASRYENKIRQALRVYNRDDGEDMAAYYHGNNTVVAKLRSAVWDFKRCNGELYGCVTVETAGQLSAEQEADLKDWITGQNSDGLGKGCKCRADYEMIRSFRTSRICLSYETVRFFWGKEIFNNEETHTQLPITICISIFAYFFLIIL